MFFPLRPLDADYPSRAPHAFRLERALPVPPERAFAVLADPAEWPRWFPDMRGMRWLSPEGERSRVGAVRRADTGSGDVIEHFVAWEPGVRLAFFAERMTTPLVSEFFEDYRLEPTSEGRCRLLWTIAYRPRLLVRPLHPLIRPRFLRMFEDAADALVRHLGGGARP